MSYLLNNTINRPGPFSLKITTAIIVEQLEDINVLITTVSDKLVWPLVTLEYCVSLTEQISNRFTFFCWLRIWYTQE